MKIAICSRFRNATAYLERYCEQMDALQAMLGARGDTLTLVLGYGDSDDGTGAALWDETVNRFDAHLMDVSHGGKHYGSIEHPTRFKQLAGVANKLLDNVPGDADVYGHVEGDLIWQAQTMIDLIAYCGPEAIAHLAYVPAIVPMIMDGESSFYDCWGFRKNGVRFTKTPPYHTDLDRCCDLVQLDSAGSVLFVRAELARKARYSDGEEIVGFCRDIYRHGGAIWLDPSLSVSHHPLDGTHRPAHRAPRASGLLRLRAKRQVYQ